MKISWGWWSSICGIFFLTLFYLSSSQHVNPVANDINGTETSETKSVPFGGTQSWSFLSKSHSGCSAAASSCSQVSANFPHSPQGYMSMFACTQIQTHAFEASQCPQVLSLSWIRLNHLRIAGTFLGWKRHQRVQPQHCQASPEHLLNLSRDGDPTTAPGSLSHSSP